MNKKTKEEPSISEIPESLDDVAAYMSRVMVEGMEAQLSPLPSDPQSPQKKQSPSKKG